MFSLWIDCDHLDAPAGISSRSLNISFITKLKFEFNVFFFSFSYISRILVLNI